MLVPIWKKINKDRITDFLISKYSGDTLEVKSYLAENFYNQHAPVIGLGINVAYKDDHLLVVDNFRKDSSDFFEKATGFMKSIIKSSVKKLFYLLVPLEVYKKSY